MHQIYPQECLDQVKIWEDRIADYSKKLVEDFNKKYPFRLQPDLNEVRNFQRFLLQNPYREMCIKNICHIYGMYVPTIILTSEEAKGLTIEINNQ